MKTSIIVCTYNPTVYSFKKLLKQLVVFFNEGNEVIIVDNNSSIDLLNITKSIISDSFDSIKYIVEKRQGLSYARKRGIEESKGDIIIFFDDDNLPDNNYVKVVDTIFEENSHIGIVGPGNVDAIFFDSHSNVVELSEPQLKLLYQEKHIPNFEFTNSINCTVAFPEGTGMAMRRSIALGYAENVESYQTTGRKGETLASGEDFQIIYQCFQHGYSAGRHPKLFIKHLIQIEKTAISYVRRLKFGQTYSVPLARQECFVSEKESNRIISNGLTNFSFLFGMIKVLFLNYRNKYILNIEMARKCGWYYGYKLADNKRAPYLVELAIRFLKLH